MKGFWLASARVLLSCTLMLLSGVVGAKPQPRDCSKKFYEGRYEEALKVCEEVYDANPGANRLFIAHSHHHLGHFEDALRNYVRYLDLKLGPIEENSEWFVQSLDRVREQAELDHVTPLTFILIGRAQFFRGQVAEALRSFERAWEVSPIPRPEVRQSLEQYSEQALAQFRPGNPGQFLLVARAHYRQGQPEQALRYYEQSLKQALPAKPAERRQVVNEVIDCDALLQPRIQDRTSRPEALLSLAQVKLLLRDAPAALRAFRQFRSREPLPEIALKGQMDKIRNEACRLIEQDAEHRAEARDICAANVVVVPLRKDKPLYKKWWLWTVVGVVAAGVVVGSVAGTVSRPVPFAGPIIILY